MLLYCNRLYIRRCIAMLAVTLMLPGPLAAEPYYTRRADGWFWYHNPVVEQQEQQQEEQQPQQPQQQQLQRDYKQQLATFQNELEQSLARAILQPEPQHLQHYMRLNAQSLAMAGRFADVWQGVLQHQPGLDYRLQYPADDQALQSINLYDAVTRDRRLSQLAEEYGLWFMFRGDCPVCHRFAQVVRNFADRYGFTVLAVSLDGGVLPEFPQPQMDRGVAAMLEVDLVPALFLVAPQRRSFNAVGYGYMSSEVLGRRLLQASESPPVYGGSS